MAEVKLEPDDAYVVSVLESMRDSPEAFSRQAIKGIADRLLAAWNRRSGGWRPIEEAPKDGTWLWATGKAYGSGDRHYAAVRWANIFWEDDEGTLTPTSPTSCTSHP